MKVGWHIVVEWWRGGLSLARPNPACGVSSSIGNCFRLVHSGEGVCLTVSRKVGLALTFSWKLLYLE